MKMNLERGLWRVTIGISCIMSAVLLGGCAWFDVQERRLADYRSQCARHGYKYGTPLMAQCVESRSRAREQYLNGLAEESFERDMMLIE